MKKISADLLRVRANRDNFQKKVDIFVAQDAKGKAHLKNIETLAQSRSQRIKTLESELNRLKICMAGNSGELGLVRFFNRAETDDPYHTLVAKLESLSKENSVLQETISSIQSDSVVPYFNTRQPKLCWRKRKK